MQPFCNLIHQLASVFAVFQQLADQSYGKAYFPLARMYWGGQGISKNCYKAEYYSRMAFDWCIANQELNDPEIWTDLGLMYEYESEEEAAFWYSKAAKQGNPNAQNLLGLMWKNGNCEEGENFDEAYFWYRKAAEQGHAEAQTNLGLMWEYGDGVEQDNDEAVYWYGKAAEQGHADGQYYLGRMYQDWYGGVVGECYFQTEFWWRKAAEQGNPNGQCALGWLYKHGWGLVEQDDIQAEFWYRKAAEQGNKEAQNNLTNRGINWKDK